MMNEVMSSLSSATADMENMLVASRAGQDEIQQRMARFETGGRDTVSGPNISSSSSYDALPNIVSNIVPEAGGEDAAAAAQTSSVSPYNASFLTSLSKAGMKKDDKVINLLLNKHGNPQDVIASLEGVERYFPDRLDTTAKFLAQQVGLHISSWISLKAAVLNALEDDDLKSSSTISLGYVLKHVSEKLPPSPEKVHGKARRKK